MRIQFFILFLGLALVPVTAFAAVNTLFGLGDLAYQIITRVGILLWVLAIAIFFWGLVKFIANAGDTVEHEKGKSLIMWGVISFVVLVSLWGIVEFLNVSFGLSPTVVPEYRDKGGIIVTR